MSSNIRIELFRQYSHYTNLDVIDGRVILHLKQNERIPAVVVKLEGESKTRLIGTAKRRENDQEKERTELEFHKILYKTQEVFPAKEIKNAQGYSLPPGHHEWPFSFKLPFNNNCEANEKLFGGLTAVTNFISPEGQAQHVKRSLPPSLSGFPGLAEIKYYIKVTVQRSGLLKENYRAVQNFRFLPIEPIRPPESRTEQYARRQYQFTANLPPPPERKSSIFSLKRNPSEPAPSGEPPRFKVDARIPNPAILTCNDPIPLRVLVTKLSEAKDTLYLLQFQIQLIGTTYVRAHDFHREEKQTWVITSRSALNMPLGKPADVSDTEIPLDTSLWKSIPLPSTVAPSFETCNIRRAYEIEVRVGISYGKPGKVTPQQVVLPLRIPVQVFSGIKPPAELVERMTAAPSTLPSEPTNLTVPTPSVTTSNHYPISSPHTPTYTSFPPATGTPVPVGGGAGGSQPQQTLYPPQLAPGQNAAWDAPPSYEDAIAGDIGPVDGPRREYGDAMGPSQGQPQTAAGAGGKDERLFPEGGERGISRR